MGSGRESKPRPKSRQLVRWNTEMDVQILIVLQKVCQQKGIRLPWEAIAKEIGTGTPISSGALLQHLAKIRHRLSDSGVLSTESLRPSGSGADKVLHTSGASSTAPYSGKRRRTRRYSKTTPSSQEPESDYDVETFQATSSSELFGTPRKKRVKMEATSDSDSEGDVGSNRMGLFSNGNMKESVRTEQEGANFANGLDGETHDSPGSETAVEDEMEEDEDYSEYVGAGAAYLSTTSPLQETFRDFTRPGPSSMDDDEDPSQSRMITFNLGLSETARLFQSSLLLVQDHSASISSDDVVERSELDPNSSHPNVGMIGHQFEAPPMGTVGTGFPVGPSNGLTYDSSMVNGLQQYAANALPMSIDHIQQPSLPLRPMPFNQEDMLQYDGGFSQGPFHVVEAGFPNPLLTSFDTLAEQQTSFPLMDGSHILGSFTTINQDQPQYIDPSMATRPLLTRNYGDQQLVPTRFDHSQPMPSEFGALLSPINSFQVMENLAFGGSSQVGMSNMDGQNGHAMGLLASPEFDHSAAED